MTEIAFTRSPAPGLARVAFVYATGVPGGVAEALDRAAGGAVWRAWGAAPRGPERERAIVDLVEPPGLAIRRLLLVGTGTAAVPEEGAATALGGAIAAALEAAGEEAAAILVEAPDEAAAASFAAALAAGARLRTHRLDRHHTAARSPDRRPLRRLELVVPDPAAAEAAFRRPAAVAEGTLLARDLTDEPANILTPAALAERARSLAALGLEVAVLEEAALRRLGCGALLAVGQGSANRPCLVTLRWAGGDSASAPVALVGKGVTFDTGGISIKPPAKMWEMKGDMAGAAAVLGTMAALARAAVPVHAVAVLPLAENMMSATAQRPGDVVTTFAGQTVEVVDTDAEGRLILADALAYAVATFRPRLLVDVATLTGSIIRALGGGFAGLFATDDTLAAGLIAAGEAVGERLWRMPLDPFYDDALKSEIADIRQVAPDEASADAVHGAMFLKRFTGDVPWAHIDTGLLTEADTDRPLCPKGATGFPTRLLFRWITDGLEADGA